MANKPDLVLTDGTEIVFDFSQITVGEWRSLWDRTRPANEGDEIVARVAGLDAERITEMNYIEYRKLLKKFYEIASDPIDQDQKN